MSPEEKKRLLNSVDGLLNFSSERTGLPVRQHVESQLVEREEVKRRVEENLRDQEKAERLERSMLVLKKLGLVPNDYDPGKSLVEATGDQLAGYYDPKTKRVYVLTWLSSREQYAVLAHELTHALQDQAVNLETWPEATTTLGKAPSTEAERDEQMATRRAVLEGQATAIMVEYGLTRYGRDLSELPVISGSAMDEIVRRFSPPTLLKAPRYMREWMMFPYTYGLAFVHEVLIKRGRERAFAGLLKNPPASTHQVMHPASYLAGEKIPPLAAPAVETILGSEFKRLDSGSLGEFDVLLFAQQYATEEVARKICPQWRGGYYFVAEKRAQDELEIVSPPGKDSSVPTSTPPQDEPTRETGPAALFYLSRWATAAVARQFADIYAASVPLRYVGAAARGSSKERPALDRSLVWDTSEGPVFVEVNGSQVLVMESFDMTTAAKLRAAVTGEKNSRTVLGVARKSRTATSSEVHW